MTYVIIGLSVITVVLSWVLFPQYSKFYIESHVGSFDSLPSQRFKDNTVIFILAVRSMFAVGWISSLMYMRRLVRACNKHLLAIISVYAVISLFGYGALVFQDSMTWQTIVRAAQALAGAGLVVIVLLPPCRRSMKRYVEVSDS